MVHNILITGGSGYLGGTLLARWKDARLPPYGTLYALVRSDEQSEAVKQYGAEPLRGDTHEHDQLAQSIIDRKITVVFFLVSSGTGTDQLPMIKALQAVKSQTQHDVHFLHTSGAKIFSRHAGISTDAPLLDTDPNLYDIQKNAVAPYDYFVNALQSNVGVIDAAEAAGARSYIFAPCIVYGEGEGFGKRISIQDVEIVNAAKKLRRVYKVDTDNPTWPVCHVIDNTTLYLQILRQILSGHAIGYNKNGFYLAASGSVAWNDIYRAFATALARRGVVDDDRVEQADAAALSRMGEALGMPPSLVTVMLGGKCTFTPVHGGLIGWKAQYPPEHILEAADDEVELILRTPDPRQALKQALFSESRGRKGDT